VVDRCFPLVIFVIGSWTEIGKNYEIESVYEFIAIRNKRKKSQFIV
jgi:hypothetical protein